MLDVWPIGTQTDKAVGHGDEGQPRAAGADTGSRGRAGRLPLIGPRSGWHVASLQGGEIEATGRFPLLL